MFIFLSRVCFVLFHLSLYINGRQLNCHLFLIGNKPVMVPNLIYNAFIHSLPSKNILYKNNPQRKSFQKTWRAPDQVWHFWSKGFLLLKYSFTFSVLSLRFWFYHEYLWINYWRRKLGIQWKRTGMKMYA